MHIYPHPHICMHIHAPTNSILYLAHMLLSRSPLPQDAQVRSRSCLHNLWRQRSCSKRGRRTRRRCWQWRSRRQSLSGGGGQVPKDSTKGPSRGSGGYTEESRLRRRGQGECVYMYVCVYTYMYIYKCIWHGRTCRPKYTCIFLSLLGQRISVK